jgi:hypothetical protein
MKTKRIAKRVMAVVAIVFTSVAGAQAQSQRLQAFQDVVMNNEALYRELMHSDRHQEAVAPLTTLINLFDTTTIYKEISIPEAAIRGQKGLYYYDLACCYALMGQKAKGRSHREQALQALGQSVANGYKDYNNMLNDNDLLSLRKDKRFQALLAEVKSRRPLEVLKQSAPYAKDASEGTVKFLYQPLESMNLRMVREYFSLDSVAGQGDELSKIINLLHFAHDKIRHDGANRAFAEMDAIDLYNYCKATGKGVNCRQLAIALCEMYLSMGMPARYVTCMPADPNDYECHVINTVWSEQLQKWLYIDPTMDAWVTDENGVMLSIAEVRERLRTDGALVLCETANWNHETPQTKEHYLDEYMSKNLYYFVCKKISRFNPESLYRTNDPADDVKLVPEGFVCENWTCDTTTDPDVFWARPE